MGGSGLEEVEAGGLAGVVPGGLGSLAALQVGWCWLHLQMGRHGGGGGRPGGGLSAPAPPATEAAGVWSRGVCGSGVGVPTSPPPASAFICAMGVDGRASRWPRGMSRQGRGAEERGWVSAPWKRELQGVLWPPTSAEGPLLGAPGAAAGLRGAAARDRTSGIQPHGPRGHGPGPPGDECGSSRPWNRGKTREGRSAGLLRHIPSQRGVGSPPGFCFHAPRAQTCEGCCHAAPFCEQTVC